MANAYRADQVGSLLRPAEIVTARHAGAITPDELRTLEDRHIQRVLERQRAIGLDVVTDGELRRSNFMSDLWDAVDGFDFGDEITRSWSGNKVSAVTGVVNRKLAQRRPLTGPELPFLQQHAGAARIKMTLPSATQFPAIAYKRGITDKAYPTPSDLLWDIAEIIKKEMAALAGAGVHYLQIDAPRYSYYIDPKWRAWLRDEFKVDPDASLDEAVRVDNACFDAARKAGVTVAIHLCRGNNRSHWYAEGGYDAIAEKLFGELRVDRFLLEYDDERSGGFEPLRLVPRGKLVVLGLVSSKLAEVESADDLRRRIDQASKFVPLEELALSPQCGFASTMEGNLVSEDIQWAKLKLVADTARAVWGTA